MSYELADGSMSTDYKIGDKFTHEDGHDIFVFIKDDGTLNPWFRREGKGADNARHWEYPRHWENLTPVKSTKHTDLIKSIRETVQYLERTIQELEA